MKALTKTVAPGGTVAWGEPTEIEMEPRHRSHQHRNIKGWVWYNISNGNQHSTDYRYTYVNMIGTRAVPASKYIHIPPLTMLLRFGFFTGSKRLKMYGNISRTMCRARGSDRQKRRAARQPEERGVADDGIARLL